MKSNGPRGPNHQASPPASELGAVKCPVLVFLVFAGAIFPTAIDRFCKGHVLGGQDEEKMAAGWLADSWGARAPRGSSNPWTEGPPPIDAPGLVHPGTHLLFFFL